MARPRGRAAAILLPNRSLSLLIRAVLPRYLSALTCHGVSDCRSTASLWWWSSTLRSERQRLGAPIQATRHGHSRFFQSFLSHEEDPKALSRALHRRRRPYPGMSSLTSLAQAENERGEDLAQLYLVDVDCNLWHKDLRPLISSKCRPSLSASKSGTRRDGEDDTGTTDDSLDPFAILEGDDMTHCAAIVSPSSTVLEARMGLQSLLLRQRQRERSADDDEVDDSCSSKANGAVGVVGLSLPTTIPIRTTVGIHPYHVKDEDCGDVEESRSQLEDLLEDASHAPHIAAIGECGLDASPGFPPLSDQIPFFRMQIELACEHNKPLFVHERLAFEACCQLLDAASATVPVIVHCFTGTRDECVEYVRRGYYLSVSGYVFKDETLAEILKGGIIPLDRLMVETDAPYMGFAGCRARYLDKHSTTMEATLNSKQRKKLSSSLYPNLPSSLPMVFEKVREHVNAGRVQRHEPELSRTEFAQITTRNANQFFGFGLPSLPCSGT